MQKASAKALGKVICLGPTLDQKNQTEAFDKNSWMVEPGSFIQVLHEGSYGFGQKNL